MIIRFFDILFSLLGLIILLPFLIVVSILILLSSKGSIFFIQERIGKNGKPFKLVKFRSMRTSHDNQQLITVGDDPRITPVGKLIRKYKIDELPQLYNVLRGEMSIVGPRPEVPKYVDLYTTLQKRVLSIKPGLTDYASIRYIDENKVLAKSNDPERTYINVIIPEKIRYNIKYIEHQSVKEYFKIIFLTISRIFSSF